ncbi:metal ABC transporter permease [Phytomonospora endophytica]|uniref:metal ABC transporter permease n=1 Tax=Phytomonospora endophytica TaxID=714109 RepID=UPI00161F070B|nr:metal ABC transporter permease [Phytomonospora endophytica]
MSIFGYDFMMRALIGALIIGVAAPSVGVFLVQKRMALIGDGIGHVALTGVAVGFLMGTSPVWTAVVVTIVGAVAIELIRERGKASGDVALALLFYGGIAGGVVLIGMSAGKSNATLMSYLFGSLVTTSAEDLRTIAILGALVTVLMVVLRPWLFAVSQDEEYAKVSGVPVRFLNMLLAVTTAVTVTVAMRAVGLLLISALLVVPVATMQQFARGFTVTMFGAMGLGVVAAGSGVVVAGVGDLPPGAMIVLMALGLFVLVAVVTAVVKLARRTLLPTRPATVAATAPEPLDCHLDKAA